MKHKNIYRLILAVTALLFPLAVHAQLATLTGVVRDSSGQPVIGAAVVLQGDNTKGSITDKDGKYSLFYDTAQDTSTVVVSCISYKTVTEHIGGRAVIDFVLEDEAQALDEVVVVGYGAMRRSDLTGSLASIKVDETTASHSNSLDQLLQGAASGVEVISNSAAPGAGVSIRIRGMTSLNGSSEPLYVVDGVIMTDAVSGDITSQMAEESNGLMGLNPQDIASIEILKDASATAIYGADGANGVVLITTKQGNQSRPVIRFNAGWDWQTVTKRIDVLGFDEYVSLLQDRTDSFAASALRKIYDDPDMRTGLNVLPMDWQDYTIRKVLNQRHYFSVSGYPKDIRYSLSIGVGQQQGIVRSTGVDQYTIRLNVDKNFTPKLTVGTKFNFAYIHVQTQQGANSDAVQASASMMKSILSYRPFLSSTSEDDIVDDEEMESYSGPDQWIKNAKAVRKEYRVTPSVYARYKLNDNLTLRSQLGGDYRSNERTEWKGRKVSHSTGAIAGVSNAVRYRWSWDTTLDFSKKMFAHSLSGTLGTTIGADGYLTYTDTGTNILQEAIQVSNINSAYIATSSFSETDNSRASFFARGIYNYVERYVLTATCRLDGSSRFQGSNRFALFPSVAAAWRVSQEPWFIVPQISLLKLRFGWGEVGNSAVSSYQTYNLYSTTPYGNHANEAGYSTGIYQSNFSNSNLKWETTQQWNAGIDLSLFRGRIAFTADAYYKRTYDLLQIRYVPLASGFSNRWVNQGNILNKGLEFSLDLVPLKTKTVEWTVSGNLSINRNAIQSLGFAVDEKKIYLEEGVQSMKRYYLGANIAASTYLVAPANIFMEGKPLGLYYGYRTDGIVQEGETGTMLEGWTQPQQPGQIRYVDMNGDGIINEDDRTVIGDFNPDFTYGFKTSLKVARLTLSLNFDGVAGKDLLNANLAQLTDPSWQYVTNVVKDAYRKAWTPENRGNYYVSLSGWTNYERSMVTDRYIEDASYLRLSLVSLNYTVRVPKKLKSTISWMSAGVSCSNPVIITSYSGWSPMVNSFGHSMTKMGIDLGSYPLARTWSFDLKFKF